MNTSNERQIMDIYASLIPRFDWFTQEEQVKLVMKAAWDTRINNDKFLKRLDELVFIRSFQLKRR